jgi:hypothetical protein
MTIRSRDRLLMKDTALLDTDMIFVLQRPTMVDLAAFRSPDILVEGSMAVTIAVTSCAYTGETLGTSGIGWPHIRSWRFI